MQVQVKTNVLAKNDAIAESLQQLFKEKNIFVFNLLGSPGAGKTSLLEATLQDLKKDYRLAVIEGDLFTAKDAECFAPLDRTAPFGFHRPDLGRYMGCLPVLLLPVVVLPCLDEAYGSECIYRFVSSAAVRLLSFVCVYHRCSPAQHCFL